MPRWVKITLHFPSFFSYRIPDYSSQYALNVPLPSPSTVKLALVATAIRTTGNVSEGKRVFYAIKDADIRIKPPKRIVVNSFLIKRLKRKKTPTELETFESTFGVREYVFFSDNVDVFIGCDNMDAILKYLKMLRYLGTGDSIVYVMSVSETENPPENAVKAVTGKEFANTVSSTEHVIVYPVKDLSKNAKIEQINPHSTKSSKNVFERKYYLIRAKMRKGRNWKLFDMQF